jgi:hypothetical protein
MHSTGADVAFRFENPKKPNVTMAGQLVAIFTADNNLFFSASGLLINY